MTESDRQITGLLRAWRCGDAGAIDALMPLVYSQLRVLASRYMRQEHVGHTLGPTALVHEAYFKLLSADTPWEDRAHFMAIAAITMRRILVDYARNHRRSKRGSGAEKVALEDVLLSQPPMSLDILALDRAITRLSLQDARKGKLIELSYFGGLSCEEAATVLEISTSTVNRELKMAKAWLRQELSTAETA
jgi:RNA polymerase sigma-70 factor (ECF subfamily)